MPTGFTSALEKRKWDVKTWLKEDLVRGLGVCCILREDGNMSQEQISKALKSQNDDDSLSYHSKKLERAKANLAAAKKKTARQWKAEWKEFKAKMESEKKAWLVKGGVSAAKYAETVAKLKSLRPVGEIAAGAVRFALQQLELVKDEFDLESVGWRFSYPKTPLGLKRNEIGGLENLVKFAQEDVDEHVKATPRSAMYEEYVKEVDTWF
jgi:hypothetical protein